MKYKTPQEIFATTPEENVREVFVDIFGIDLGQQVYTEFSTDPDFRERYQAMISRYIAHQKAVEKLIEDYKTAQEKHDARWMKHRAIMACVLIVAIVVWLIIVAIHFGNLALQ